MTSQPSAAVSGGNVQDSPTLQLSLVREEETEACRFRAELETDAGRHDGGWKEPTHGHSCNVAKGLKASNEGV